MAQVSKRSKFLIGGVQSRLLKYNATYLLVALGACFASLIATLAIGMFQGSMPMDEQYRATTQFLVVGFQAWPFLLLVVAFLMVHGVFLSHRIAGPLVRFKMVFKAVKEGDLSVRTGIRTKDLLHDESQELTAMVQSLNEWCLDTAGHMEALRTRVAELQVAQGAGATEEAGQLLQALQLDVAAMDRQLDHFTTVSEAVDAEQPAPSEVESPVLA